MVAWLYDHGKKWVQYVWSMSIMRLRFPDFVRDRPGRENAVSQPPKNRSLAMENDDEPVELQIAHFRMYFQSYFWSTFFFQPSSYWKFEWWPMLGVAESGPGNHVHVSQNIQLLTIRFGSKQNHNIHPHLLMRLYETISNSREIEITKFFGDWFSSLKCFGFWPTGNMGFCSKSATKNLRTKNPERHQTRSRSTCT